MRRPLRRGTIAPFTMGAAPEAATICPRIFGRELELATLKQLVQRLVEGRGKTVLLSGEAGIGKSRLVAEARGVASTSGVRVLQGSAFELDRALPYGPIADLFRSLVSSTSPQELLELLGPAVVAVGRLLPTVGAWLPSDFDKGSTRARSGPDLDRQQLLQGLLLAFERVIQQGPTMIVIEDVHWADEASLDLLLHLARSAADRALLLVFTLRSEDAGPSALDLRIALVRQRLVEVLALAPLDRSEVEAMVHCLVRGTPRLDMLETIVGLSEGNPFFVEEVVRSALSADDAAFQSGTVRVPRSVHDAVLRRVNHLAEPARRALQLAAVAGRRFDFGLLQRLLAIDERELLPIIRELIAAQLIVEDADDRLAFRHALTRQAVYGDLLGRERRALHTDALAVLEQLANEGNEVVSEDLAYHAHAAADWPKTATYAQLAGERALRMHAPRAAVEHFGHAVDAAEKLGQAPSPSVMRGRGQAYSNVGQLDFARADFEGALKSAIAGGDTRLEWQLLVDLSMLWSLRNYVVAGEYAERSLAVARELGDKGCIARSLDRVGNWQLNVGHVRQALEYQEQALDLMESLGDRRGVGDTLNLLGMTSAFVDSEQSATYYSRAIPLMREFDDRQGLLIDLVMRTVVTGFYWGDTIAPARPDPTQAEFDIREALALARAIDWPAGESFAHWELALWYGPRGRYAQAFDLASSGLRIAEEIEHKQWIAAALCSLGALYVDVFAPERARPLLERALALARELGSSVWIPYSAACLARASTLERNFSSATAVLEAQMHPDTRLESITDRQLWCAQAELLLAQGAAAEALAVAKKLIGSSRTGQVAPRVGILRANVLTALRSFDEAERILTEAIDVSRASGLKSLLWRAHASYARLLRLEGRRDEAAGQIQMARTLVDELAAELDEDVLRAAFMERAVTYVPRIGAISERRVTKQAFGGLTARERQVAALIGRGLSNRAIAEELVVGERTVESYVSSILAKLGFTARTQIAAWAATRGIAPHSD